MLRKPGKAAVLWDSCCWPKRLYLPTYTLPLYFVPRLHNIENCKQTKNKIIRFISIFQNCKEKIDTCASLDIMFVLYSITDRSSFQEATLIVKYLHEAKNIPSSAIFLIASKADQKRHTEVTEFEGKLFAVNTGCCFHQLSNSEGFTEHSKIIKQAHLRVSLGSPQKPPKSPLMRRLKGGRKNKSHTAAPGPRDRSGSVEF